MSIRHAILGLLSDGPLHGYALKTAYEEGLVPGATLNIGQVYPALEKLEADGWATAAVVAQSERPDRRVYTITEAGRAELRAWLAAEPTMEAAPRDETYLRLVLALRLRGRGGDAAGVIAAARRRCLERLHDLAAARERAEGEAGLPERMLLELAVQRQEAFHRWLERCEQMIEGGAR